MSVLKDIRSKIDERIAELEPLVAEHQELVKVRAQLEAEAAPARGRRRRSTGQSARRGGSGGGGTRRRTRGGNTRARQALKLVGERPGITTAEMAQAMGIDPNYLYRVLPRLEQEGQLERQGKGWHPVAGAGDAPADAA
jgi:CRP-like cAMP-binding protein